MIDFEVSEATSRLVVLRDESAGKHAERTQILCRLLVLELREEAAYENVITDAYINNIYHAASLHDVGKKALQRALDKDSQNEFIKYSIEMASCRHEKWDGSGSPEGLYGLDIPLSARVMALVDAYEALRSKCHYKEPLSHAQSVKIIKEGGAIQFDPSVVKAFSSIESKFEDIFEAMRGEEPK